MTLGFDAGPGLLIDEHRQISAALAEGMRLAVADAAASAQADEAAVTAAADDCIHCGGPTAPGAPLCDSCASGHEDCAECGPLDEDAEP